MTRRPLRRSHTLGAALLALTFALPAAAQDAPLPPAADLTGEWVLTVELGNGTGTRDVHFVQEGNDLTGTVSSSMASGELTGTIEGDQVRFTVLLAMETTLFEVTYVATWREGRLVEGSVDLGSYDQGTFTGQRKEPSGADAG